MKKEQRVMAWTALQYYKEMAEKNKKEATTDKWKSYWEDQYAKAEDAQEAVLKRR